jgi:hypothetical protein
MRDEKNETVAKINCRGIVFKAILEGSGIVQHDHVGQKYAYMHSVNTAGIEGAQNNNFLFGKAEFTKASTYTEENPKFYRKIKVSGAGLRHAISKDAQPFHSPQIFQNSLMRRQYVCSEDAILRGYLYTPDSDSVDTEILKRASAYTISDAIEEGNAISNIEVRTNLEMDKGKRSGTSLFYEETTGKTKYHANGYIDFGQLQFISASSLADRKAIADDDIPDVLNTLNSKYGENSVKLGYWYQKSAQAPLSEKGIMLSDAALHNLVKYFFTKLSALYMHKQSAYMRTTQIEVKFIDDPTEEFFGEDSNWITIYQNGNLDLSQIEFASHSFFSETTLEEVEANIRACREIDELTAKAKKAAEKSKQDKKDKKKAAAELSESVE